MDRLEKALVEALGGDSNDAWDDPALSLMIGECDAEEIAAAKALMTGFDPEQVAAMISIHQEQAAQTIAQRLPRDWMPDNQEG